MNVHEIPGKVSSEWRDDVKAMVDTWTTYAVSLDEFKEAVMDKGVNHAKANGVQAWIVDSSTAKGAFSQEIQEFISTDCLPTFARIGVKYFITITSQVSAITKMTVAEYSAKMGPNGIKLVELGSVDDAVEWLKANG